VGSGLCSAIVSRSFPDMRGGWVYIVTNRPRGVLYIGVTADLAARVAQHRGGTGSSFCRRYNLKRLVLAEPYPTIDEQSPAKRR
jgi:putative endonuclease